MQGVYQIRNKIDGKRYIGGSQDIEVRLHKHKRKLKVRKHDNIHLQRAWDKHGEENFVFEAIETVEGVRNAVYAREQEYLDEWFPTEMLYNRSKMASCPPSPRGVPKSEEHKQNLSKARLGHKVSRETRNKLSAIFTGRIPWNKGKPRSEKAIELQRKSMLEYYKTHDSPMKGKHHSDSTKDQMRESAKGKKQEGKPYPAFYNTRTGQAIPPGTNLATLCRAHQLNYNSMLGLKLGKIKSTKDGWLLEQSFGAE